MLKFTDYKDKISKSVMYHVENNIPFAENIYRIHSEEFYKLFRDSLRLEENKVEDEGHYIILIKWAIETSLQLK